MHLSTKLLLLILFVFLIFGLRIVRDSLSYPVSGGRVKIINSAIGRSAYFIENNFSKETPGKSNIPDMAPSGFFYNIQEIPSFMATGNEPELKLIINDSIAQFVDKKYQEQVVVPMRDSMTQFQDILLA
jgi:hypothetical protein